MQTTEALLGLLRERGKRGLPLTRIYRQLLNPNLYLSAYGRIYRNKGAMTPGVTEETADGMSLENIERIIQAVRQERYQWQPARRTYLLKKNGKKRPLGMPIGLSYCLSFPAMFGMRDDCERGWARSPSPPFWYYSTTFCCDFPA